MTAVKLENVHLSAVAEIEAHCFSEPWSASALTLLTTEQATGAVCLSEGKPIAYGGMLWAPDEGQITNVAVLSDHRGKGCGEAVLLHLIGQARTRGCEIISLEVRASNTAAIRLYEKHGFCVRGQRKRFYRNPTEDALVMILDL